MPREDAEKVRGATIRRSTTSPRYQAETHHDVTAFLKSVADSLGAEGRWVHLGLTSQDVWDTATALQLVDAADDPRERPRKPCATCSNARALEFKDTLCIGRTHGVHAEPTTFGLKLAGWAAEIRRSQGRLAEAKAQISYGKISGAVGTHATVPPDVEEQVCAHLGLMVEPVSTQVVPRDRHALLHDDARRHRRVARALRDGAAPPPAHGGARGRGAVREGQTGSSAMPHKRNPELCERICGLARVIRGYA